VQIKDGSHYEGQWIGDKRHGFGKQEFPNGDTYVGYYQANLPSGQGKFTY